MVVGYAQVQINAFVNLDMYHQDKLQTTTNPLLNQVPFGSLGDIARVYMNMDMVYAQFQR